MNLQEIKPTDLSPNPWNTNSVPPAEMEKLTASLERHGFIKPVLARETETGLEILGGEHRVQAAIQLGYDTVPVVNLGPLSESRAKEIGLIDNARYGQDDAIGLAELLADLGGADLMATFLPIGEAELASLSTDIGDDDIDALLDETEEVAHEPEKKPAKTHQVMRFKVPVADADMITEFFEKIMDWQEFNDADSLTNAGDALVHVVKTFVPGEETIDD